MSIILVLRGGKGYHFRKGKKEGGEGQRKVDKKERKRTDSFVPTSWGVQLHLSNMRNGGTEKKSG